MRLDQFLARSGERSRSEAARLLRAGRVFVNGQPVREGGTQLPSDAQVLLDGQPVDGSRFQYIMLHKPAGVLTAARDAKAATVMGLVPESLARRKVLPVGRLDKDTTGLLLLTNDGDLAHYLLSPKRHVTKRYLATVAGPLTIEDQRAFQEGMALSDFTALPARLEILCVGQEQSKAAVELREGKFHQVKRMFAAVGHPVLTLHRESFGCLRLPPDLLAGQWRPLREDELTELRRCAGLDANEGNEDAHA